MLDYGYEYDYLEGVNMIPCEDDPINACLRIAYESEVNYKRIEEAVNMDIMNEADGDKPKKSILQHAKDALNAFIEMVRRNAAKMMGVFNDFLNQLSPDQKVEDALKTMSGSATLPKKIKYRIYDTGKVEGYVRLASDNCKKLLEEYKVADGEKAAKFPEEKETKFSELRAQILGFNRNSSSLSAEGFKNAVAKELIVKDEETDTINIDEIRKRGDIKASKAAVKSSYKNLKDFYNNEITAAKHLIKRLDKKDANDNSKAAIARANAVMEIGRFSTTTLQIVCHVCLAAIKGQMQTRNAVVRALLSTATFKKKGKDKDVKESYSYLDSVELL